MFITRFIIHSLAVLNGAIFCCRRGFAELKTGVDNENKGNALPLYMT